MNRPLMVIPPCGTFDYVAVVPETIADGAFQCPARSRETIEKRGSVLADYRLVGSAPYLCVTDDSLTSKEYGGRPETMRTRVTLSARTRDAQVAETYFHVSKRLTTRLAPGDVLYLSATNCGGLALSAVRSDKLIAAAGAVTRVPLGDNVKAITPRDLIADATACFRRRDREFEFLELPLEVTVDGVSAILYAGGGREVGQYEIKVFHGFVPDVPGTDECVAIARTDACSLYAAATSATWLEKRNPLAMT